MKRKVIIKYKASEVSLTQAEGLRKGVAFISLYLLDVIQQFTENKKGALPKLVDAAIRLDSIRNNAEEHYIYLRTL